MRKTAGVLAIVAAALVGCVSGPLPQSLVEAPPVPSQEPLKIGDVLRLGRAGVSDDVILELVNRNGVVERADSNVLGLLLDSGVGEPVILMLLAVVPTPPKPEPGMVYRELFLPLWPSYSGGRWHLGIRFACFYRAAGEELEKSLPPAPEPKKPPPARVDP